jgi:hypothetical protein
MKAVKGHIPKRHKVFPALSIPTKKPPREPLRRVRIKKTKEIGLLLKKTEKYADVYLRKRFPLDEIDEIKPT